MTEQQSVDLGRDASRVLDSHAYQMAMQSLRDSVLSQWKDCPIRDVEGQRLLLQLAKLTDKFEAILKGYVESGKFAQHKIDLDDLRNESAARRFARKVVHG